MQTFVNRNCPRCNKVSRLELSRRVVGNGTEHYGWWCLECNWWVPSKNGGQWVDKNALIANGVDLSLVRVVEVLDSPRCARCGQRGAELHHWAPKHLFGDEANEWPTDFLCGDCHRKWHYMLTPSMSDK